MSVFRLKTIRGPRNERRWQEVLWYQELLRGGEILTTFLTKRDGNTSEVRKINCWTARNSRYNTKHEQACVGGKAIKWPMIIQFIKGKDGISRHEFNWYHGWAQNVDDHDTFVARVHEDVIDRRRHQVKVMMKWKVIEPKGMTQTRNQACCSRRNDMMMRIDVRLVHRWKLCSEKKDRVAQLKSSRQWYSQTG